MTYVICIILGAQTHGILIETKGDKWLVYFHKTTVWVDSNRCWKEKHE